MDESLDTFGLGPVALAATRPIALEDGALRWSLRKNCALTPKRLGACLVWLSVPGLIAGLGFFVAGAPFILAFLVVQFATLACCFMRYAEHAADREEVAVSADCVEVHLFYGTSEVHGCLDRTKASVTLLGQQNLIAIAGPGLSVRVGSCLPRHVRPVFFLALRDALRNLQDADTGAMPCLRRALSQASLPSSNSRQGEGRHS